MNHLLLSPIDPHEICEFLNTTDTEYTVVSKDNHYFNDMTTGARILNQSDKILFKNVDLENENFLRLKFGNSISTYDDIGEFDK